MQPDTDFWAEPTINEYCNTLHEPANDYLLSFASESGTTNFRLDVFKIDKSSQSGLANI